MAEITLRQLRSLVVLAEELHFRRAAARLHLTQPALSHQIQQLETIVGVRLFNREGRRVTLDPAGESLAGDARRLLAELDRAVSAAQRAGIAHVPLRICHSPSISRILIPRIAGGLRDARPALDVVWIERSEELVGLELLSGRYDVVIGRFPPPGDEIEHQVLLWERPGVYLDRRDPLAALDEVSLTSLGGRRILTVRPESVPQHFEATQRDLRVAGVEADVEPTMSYGNWASADMRRQILENECVVIGLASARDTLPDVTVVPLAQPATPIPITVSWRTGDTRADVRAFVELARTVVEQVDETWLAAGPGG
jgi:LysR family transcriptional regulator, hydrogen peroxide-inducible genes activator